ncbi:MAG TPA: hydrogenase maturation protease [Terracidiphilus sp.]|nr:hydrogenase maturation protease [Terracidiphilus sp.]
MAPERSRCLVLACGNTLRGDDGVGPWLAGWAGERFRNEPGVRVISRQQWTPELAQDIARTEAVLFLDCALDAAPGAVTLRTVEVHAQSGATATHHLAAPELLALAEELYRAHPRAVLFTIGGESFGLGDEFSDALRAALPQACASLETAVLRLLDSAAIVDCRGSHLQR